jgi:hypothetical protein
MPKAKRLAGRMNLEAFKIGFWHPFGPHGREAPEAIIERKRREVAANGWTFWSFQYRRPAVFEAWSQQLSIVGPGPLPVFCSDSPKAIDPSDVGTPVSTTDCLSFRFAGQSEWQSWPANVRVPHPFRGAKSEASAFIVQYILFPVESFEVPSVEWLSYGVWRQDRVPTRGEYLIRPGGITPMRPIRAVLGLMTPYLAWVRADSAEPEKTAAMLE